MYLKVVALALLSLAALAGFAAGVTLLAVGLWKQHRPIWVSGLVTAVLAAVLGVSCSVWGLHEAIRQVRPHAHRFQAPEPGPTEAQMQEWVTRALGRDLPEGVRCIHGRRMETILVPLYTWYVVLAVDERARDSIKTDWLAGPTFQKEPWRLHMQMASYLDPSRKLQRLMPFWDVSRVRGRDYYVLQEDAGSAPDHMFVTAISYDEERGVLYFVRAESWN